MSEFNKFMETRQEQIKNNKKEKVDFNASNYDIEELVAILKFEHVPINKPIIERRIMELKRKFEGQKKYETFFDEAKTRLIDNLNLVNEQTWVEPYTKDDSKAAKLLQQQFQTQVDKETKKNQIINEEKNVIGRRRLSREENFATNSVTQGTKNPFMITEIQRIVNFDGHYRPLLMPKSVACDVFSWESNSEQRLYTATNYTVTLSQPLINVISITLDSVEIPNSWYTFSKDYGTTQFTVTFNGHSFTIIIDEGNYTGPELATAINKKLWDAPNPRSGTHPLKGYFDISGAYYENSSSIVGIHRDYLPFPQLEFKFIKKDSKMVIYNYNPAALTATFKWYDTSVADVCAATQTSETPKPGGKVDYNLGWLLGYRGQTSDVKGNIYDMVVDGGTFVGHDFSSKSGYLTSTFSGHDFSTAATPGYYISTQFVGYTFTSSDVGIFNIAVDSMPYQTHLWTDCSTVANAIYAINNAFSTYNVPATASPIYVSGSGMLIKLISNTTGLSSTLAVNDNSSPLVKALFSLVGSQTTTTISFDASGAIPPALVGDTIIQGAAEGSVKTETTASSTQIEIVQTGLQFSIASFTVGSASEACTGTIITQDNMRLGTTILESQGGGMENGVTGTKAAEEYLSVNVDGSIQTILLNGDYTTVAEPVGILIAGASVTVNGSNLKITSNSKGTGSIIEIDAGDVNALALFGTPVAVHGQNHKQDLRVVVNGLLKTIVLNSNYQTVKEAAAGILIPGASITINEGNLKITADITGTDIATSGVQIDNSSDTDAKNLFGVDPFVSKRGVHSCRWVSNISTTQSQTPPGGAIEPMESFSSSDGEDYYNGKTVPQSTVDINGPQYFMITLDDFNNNKPNKDLISLVDNATRDFQIPSYFNTQTMDTKYGLGNYVEGFQGISGYECQDIADSSNNERGCSNTSLNKDMKSNLTKAQAYTYDQIMMARTQTSLDTFASPNPTDLLSRFSIPRDSSNPNASIIYKNSDKEITKRKYFGPVKLVKFKVRLLNDKGFEVNLNGRDWSFSIVATQLYQY